MESVELPVLAFATAVVGLAVTRVASAGGLVESESALVESVLVLFPSTSTGVVTEAGVFGLEGAVSSAST